VLQAVLLFAVLAAGPLGPGWPAAVARPFLAVAVVLAVVGAWLFFAGAFGLGAQLTPYPKPVRDGEIRDSGVFGLVRHPIYGGVLLLALAWSLATSPLALVPTALLAALLEAKSRREETWLEEHQPAYGDYRRRVTRRFIPFLW
jgi:protein-S-isoprenylcysteine O-methyltransferase Ste14